MVLESTYICVDNSDYMRNGDFIPTRLQAQQDAVNLICHSKTRSNPENNVGLITLSSMEVLVTLTTDAGRILTKLHEVAPRGDLKFINGVRIAHLALKHRLSKNHKMRVIVFVGSPVEDDDKEIVKLAKRLKKEKVNVDIINFGEESNNTDKLTTFVNTINGKEGSSSHLVTVPPGPVLSDALLSSPIIMGEDGSGVVPGMAAGGFEFGVDPNEDPELALALRVSMEEQRARQEDEARKAAVESAQESGVPMADDKGSSEEALLEQAIAQSMQQDDDTAAAVPSAGATPIAPDFATMTEEEQIAYAMQMSLQQAGEGGEEGAEPMDTDQADAKKEEEEDYSEVINDPAFLQSVLEGLPGVDPQSEAIRSAMGTLTKDQKSDEKKQDEKKK